MIWVLDRGRWRCAPESGLTGHALWHDLTPASAGQTYLYYL